MGICIALAGNPNCGKTTMFNDLTGANQYVGNWPGVTVEKKEGKYTRDKDVTITDLPGIYSLSPYSPEEIVARDYLLEGGPDAVINLVDATNLERNLYLTSQILNLGIPVVIALNMMDLVEKNGDKIDVDGLSRELGCPIVPTSTLKGRGMEDVVKAAIDAARAEKAPASQMKFDAAVEEALVKIEGVLGDKVSPNAARWYAIKLFEAEDKTIADLKLSQADLDAISAIRTSIEDKLDDDAESIITAERYDAISHVVDKTVKRTRTGLTTSQKIDRVVTNRWLGLPIFIVIMFFVYWLAVSVGGGVVTDWANDGISGDGWLYTGNAAFDEATEEYEDAHSQVVAYVENILGEDEESELPSDASQEVLDALAAEEPEAPEDDADADAVAEYEDAMAEYEEAQAIVADFDEQAQASHAVASMEAEDEDGNVEEQTITFADYQKALEVEEPIRPTARGACGSRVWALSSPMPWRRPTSRRGCSPLSTTASSPASAPSSASSRRWSSCSCCWASWSCAATCPASRSSWTASSASSACPVNRSSRCSSLPAAACPPSCPPRPSRTRWTVA